MGGKLFISYRRDDDPSAAARVRDGLVSKFGKSSVFMDVDNLLAGQRFDDELEKALLQCDVLLAIMGPRWMDILRARSSSDERDFVREEIAGGLKRRIVVIPVRVGREGQLLRIPRADELPEDIRNLVHHQKHDVVHERFGRDIAELCAAIIAVQRDRHSSYAPTRIAPVLGALSFAGILAWTALAYLTSTPTPSSDSEQQHLAKNEAGTGEKTEGVRLPSATPEPKFIGVKFPTGFDHTDTTLDFSQHPETKNQLDALLNAFLSSDLQTLAEFVHPTKGVRITANYPEKSDPVLSANELRANKVVFFPNYSGEEERREPVSKALGAGHDHCKSYEGPTINKLVRITYLQKFFNEMYPDAPMVAYDCPQDDNGWNNWNSIVFVFERNELESSDRLYVVDIANQVFTP